MDPLTVRIVEVGPDTGERRVVLRTESGPEFGAFDGYKTGTDGVARPATGPWMAGADLEAVLLATVDVGVEASPSPAHPPGVVPARGDPTGVADHRFRGRVRTRGDSAADPAGGAVLLDGLDSGSDGIGVRAPGTPVAVLSVGDGDVLVNLADLRGDRSSVPPGRRVTVVAARTDLLGYVLARDR